MNICVEEYIIIGQDKVLTFNIKTDKKDMVEQQYYINNGFLNHIFWKPHFYERISQRL